MTADELRIGNWIEAIAKMGNYQMQVLPLHIETISKNPACVNPIPLSPEVLESCGFKEGTVEGFYYLDIGNDTFLVSGGEDVWVEKTVKDEDYSVALGGASNIHQLQNLYYVLCGEELPTTPKGQITK